MSFFYNLNKRLADLSAKQDAAQLAESKQADHVAQSPLTQALNEAKADTIYVQHSNGAPQKVKLTPDMKAAGKIYVQHPSGPQTKVKIPADAKKSVKEEDVAEAGYSAKAGRAGKDLGKPGKNFAKIAKGAAERYGSKEAGERVAGAVLNKLRHPKEDIENEGNAFTGALAKTPKGGNFKLGDKTFKDTSNLEEGHCPACDCAPCECNEGNAFTAALKATPKGGKFKVGGKEFTDTSSVEEGFADMDAWLASREKEKGTGRFDKKKISTGTVYTRKPETFDDPETDSEATGGAPKKKGRPKGKDKGPERVTAKSYKYKDGRPSKTHEALDSDSVMMTRPTNCSSESVDNSGEYDQEGASTKDSLHTVIRHAEQLEQHLQDAENLPTWVIEKIGQIKGMMTSVSDYIISSHEHGAEQAMHEPELDEEKVEAGKRHFFDKLAPAAKQAARVIKVMSKGKKEVDEESTDKKDTKAEKAGKQVAKDIEHDEGDKSKDDNKAEKAGKKVTKDIEYDDKKDAKEKKADKEEKVEETTVAGSVATATTSGKSSKGGMSFGKGVYEGINNSVEKMITESIAIESRMEECGEGMAPAITITADGEEAAKLMMLLKLAGLESQIPKSCPSCGASPCGCAEVVDENSPDWPTNTEKLDADPNLRTYSGGLNGPKSTGQATTPVLASQLRRQASMEESVKLEKSLFNTWKNYKG